MIAGTLDRRWRSRCCAASLAGSAAIRRSVRSACRRARRPSSRASRRHRRRADRGGPPRRVWRPRRHAARSEGRRAVRQERGRAARRRGAQGGASVAGRRTGRRRLRRRGGGGGPAAAAAADAASRGARRRGSTPADVKPLLRRPSRSTTRACCARSSSSSRTPTGSRSSPTSTTPTSKCRRRSTVDGKTYKDVGVHFRGTSSFMMVPDGLEAVAQPVVRLRRREAGARRLPDAQPAQRERATRRSCARCSTREIARALHPGAEGELRAGRHQRRELGRLRQRRSSSTRTSCATTSRPTKGARWKVPGSPGGRGGLEYLGDDVAAYKRIYEIKTKDDPKVVGRPDRDCSRC